MDLISRTNWYESIFGSIPQVVDVRRSCPNLSSSFFSRLTLNPKYASFICCLDVNRLETGEDPMNGVFHWEIWGTGDLTRVHIIIMLIAYC